MFSLDVATVDLLLYMLQWTPICNSRPTVAAGSVCMRVGVEGARAAGVGAEKKCGRRSRQKWAWDTDRAQDTEGCRRADI